MKKILVSSIAIFLSATSQAEFSTIGDKSDIEKKEGLYQSNKRVAKFDISATKYRGELEESEFGGLNLGISNKFSTTSKYGYESHIEYTHMNLNGDNVDYGEVSVGLTYERALIDRLSFQSSLGFYHASFYVNEDKVSEDDNLYAKVGLAGELTPDLTGTLFYKYRDIDTKDNHSLMFKSDHSFGFKFDYKVAKNCSVFLASELSSGVDGVSMGASYRF